MAAAPKRREASTPRRLARCSGRYSPPAAAAEDAEAAAEAAGPPLGAALEEAGAVFEAIGLRALGLLWQVEAAGEGGEEMLARTALLKPVAGALPIERAYGSGASRYLLKSNTKCTTSLGTHKGNGKGRLSFQTPGAIATLLATSAATPSSRLHSSPRVAFASPQGHVDACLVAGGQVPRKLEAANRPAARAAARPDEPRDGKHRAEASHQIRLW